MSFIKLFQGKKKHEDKLPEVAITSPRRAIDRLEEHSTKRILLRREQILADATSEKIETDHDLQLKIDNGPIPLIVNELFKNQKNQPLILEEKESYRRDGLNLPEDDEFISSKQIEEPNYLTVNKKEEPIQMQHKFPLDEDAGDDRLLELESEFDPYDESVSETGYTEVEVTLMDGKRMTYLFNIAKTKFEQQWLDEIHSVGTFTAKDIYGNLVTLAPKARTNAIVFKITEGSLPGVNPFHV